MFRYIFRLLYLPVDSPAVTIEGDEGSSVGMAYANASQRELLEGILKGRRSSAYRLPWVGWGMDRGVVFAKLDRTAALDSDDTARTRKNVVAGGSTRFMVLAVLDEWHQRYCTHN